MTGKINKNISVDNVILGFNGEHLKVLLVERILRDNKKKIVFSDHTLAGNHIFENEQLDAAAARILRELTGINGVYLEQFRAFADPKRLIGINDRKWLKSIGLDPENRVVSVAYFSLLNCNNVKLTLSNRNVSWHNIRSIPRLGYDHAVIINEAIRMLRNRMRIEPVGFELLTSKFTLSELQKVYEVVFDKKLDKRNFRRKISRMKYLIPLREKQKGVTHKPALLYMFSRDIYERTRHDSFDFFV